MTRHKAMLVLTAAVAVELGCALSTQAGDAKPAALESVFQQLVTRQGWSPAVRCVYESVITTPQGAYDDLADLSASKRPGTRLPPTDISHKGTVSLLLDFKRGRMRKETRGYSFHANERRLIPRHVVEVYDGREVKVLHPRESNTGDGYTPPVAQPELDFQTQHYEQLILRHQDFPVAMSLGHLWTSGSGFSARRLRIEPHAIGLRLHADVPHQDKTIAVLRMDPSSQSPLSEEIWVDRKRDAAVVKMLAFLDGNLASSMEIDYARQGDRWLPSGWEVKGYRKVADKHQLNHHEKAVALSWEFPASLSDSEFAIELKPGMIVDKVAQDKKFTVASDGVTLVPFATGTVAGHTWIYAAIGVLVLALALGLYLTWRRGTKPTATE